MKVEAKATKAELAEMIYLLAASLQDALLRIDDLELKVRKLSGEDAFNGK